MAGGIALVGGDEFRPTCREMDETLLRATGVDRPKVLIVPTAADKYPVETATHGVDHFASLGADASPLMAMSSEHADDGGLIAAVDAADLVYLAGGNPAHLLEVLSGSLLLDKLRKVLERGAILAGSSAGAMVMGPWMRFREWREALDLTSGVVTLPHHERAEPASVAEELQQAAPAGITVLGIDGASGALKADEGWTALGKGAVTVYRSGEWRRFTAGQRVLMD